MVYLSAQIYRNLALNMINQSIINF